MPGPGKIRFRPLEHADVEFAARAAAEVDPLHPVLASELLERWERTEKVADVRRFMVEVGGSAAGWTSLVKPHLAQGSTWLHLLIPAGAERVVESAAAHTEEAAVALDPKVLVTEQWETQAIEIRVLERRRWVEERRQRYWRLELQPNASRLLKLRAAARRRLASSGLRLATAAELGGESVYPRLHRIDETTGRDIPSTLPYESRPYPDWLLWMRPPAVVPERIWVALAGAEPVGFSFLTYEPSLVQTGYTGVLREHRNQGLARALKLETLIQAIDDGVVAVETDNDSENAPILHLNEELGYRRLPDRIELHKSRH